VRKHQTIDQRSLAMSRAIVRIIDQDPQRLGLQKAIDVCNRWLVRNPSAAHREWSQILKQPWEKIRLILLDETEQGQRLRQSDPFCGILTPRERWDIYRSFKNYEEN
jgi:hypothetical protein